MIKRILETTISSINAPGNAMILIGPRQSGKTTLLKSMLGDVLWLDGEEPVDSEFLRNATSTTIAAKFGNCKAVVIDAAQRIENIGNILNLINDIPQDVNLYVSGSCAFETKINTTEAIPGRNWVFTMLPLSFEELVNYHGLQTEIDLIEHRMIFGYYPEVVTNPGTEPNILKQIAGNYLYKDILMWEKIQKPDRLERLVQALALNIGQLVSYRQLGKMVGLTNETVEKYIQLLEKAFVVFQMNGLSGNLKNELSKSKKIYFFDNGLRNAVINQFSPLALRSDASALWENFIIAERKKYLNNHYILSNSYFWRTKDQAEINYIEEIREEKFAYQFKFSPDSKAKFSRSFIETYLPTEMKTIHHGNFQEWISVIPVDQQSIKLALYSDKNPRNHDFSVDTD